MMLVKALGSVAVWGVTDVVDATAVGGGGGGGGDGGADVDILLVVAGFSSDDMAARNSFSMTSCAKWGQYGYVLRPIILHDCAPIVSDGI